MSEITLNIIRYQGQPRPLGRNFALKLLLEKNSAREAAARHKALRTGLLKTWIRRNTGEKDVAGGLRSAKA